MDSKPKDRHLDVPAETNRDKQVNFVAQERSETDPAKSLLAAHWQLTQVMQPARKYIKKRKIPEEIKFRGRSLVLFNWI